MMLISEPWQILSRLLSGWSRPARQLILLPNSPVNTEKAYHAGYMVPSGSLTRNSRI
jgi:hypothetical protein